jgi:hypothetical protein
MWATASHFPNSLVWRIRQETKNIDSHFAYIWFDFGFINDLEDLQQTMRNNLLLIALFSLLSAAVYAQDSDIKVPEKIKPFIEANAKAIALESADLNNDGRKDYVLVFERATAEGDQAEMPERQRPLLILISDKDGKLTEAKRNEEIVYCSSCGGVFGDPFEGITVGPGTFTVNHYGGSNWRWTNAAKFNYSRIDKTWQLVRYESSSFHTSKPNSVKRKVRLPKTFGKIDIADFDPEKFQGE